MKLHCTKYVEKCAKLLWNGYRIERQGCQIIMLASLNLILLKGETDDIKKNLKVLMAYSFYFLIPQFRWQCKL